MKGTAMSIELAVIDFTPEKVDLLKRTFCREASDDELELFLYACKRTGLDPFMRQIHAVSRWDDKAKRKVMTVQTAIDGYRLIADRTGAYAGNDDAEFVADDKGPTAARVTVYKMVQGQRCPFTATARWDEYYPGDKGGFMWRKMPHVMLAKVAEALALRKAFPAELSGVYTREEMEQAGGEVVEPAAQPAAPVTVKQVEPATEPESPDGYPDHIVDSEKFVAMVRDCFESRDFQPSEFSAAVADTCKKLKITLITKLPFSKRKAMLDAVAAGKFDRFKKAAKAVA
jgi:phage recombination protein Bet